MSIISLTRGDNLDIVYTIKDENDAIVDLSSGTIAWKALRSGTSVEKISKAGVLTDAVNGITTVSLEPADTINLGGTYAIDAEHVDSSGNIYTFDDGALLVETDDTD